jgi:DNA-binding transcriptional MerR regulator
VQDGAFALFDHFGHCVFLQVILRGTRLGLSLDQIAEILGLGNDLPSEAEQTRRALYYITKVK